MINDSFGGSQVYKITCELATYLTVPGMNIYLPDILLGKSQLVTEKQTDLPGLY